MSTMQRTPQSTDQRLQICSKCPQRIVVPLLPDRCRVCGCILVLKARLTKQHCPVGKW